MPNIDLFKKNKKQQQETKYKVGRKQSDVSTLLFLFNRIYIRRRKKRFVSLLKSKQIDEIEDLQAIYLNNMYTHTYIDRYRYNLFFSLYFVNVKLLPISN